MKTLFTYINQMFHILLQVFQGKKWRISMFCGGFAYIPELGSKGLSESKED